MLIHATMIHADRCYSSDRELMGSKDYPFPPGKESSAPEADPAPEPAQPDDADQPSLPDQQKDMGGT